MGGGNAGASTYFGSGKGSSNNKGPSKGKSSGKKESHKHNGDKGRSKQGSNSTGNNRHHGNSTSSGGSHHSAVFKSMLATAAATAAAKCTNSLGSSGGPVEPHGSPGAFDLYLMAQSWAPRFCCTNGRQCKASGIQGVTDLAPHGLWPAFTAADAKGKTYPAFCSKPSSSETSGLNGPREKHEFGKHGTCTRLGAVDYFLEESRVMTSDSSVATRELLTAHADSMVATDDILEAFGGEKRAAIMVDKSCRLVEITTCWSKTSSDAVGEQTDCPAHVLASNRNSAYFQGCARVLLGEANQCSKVTDDMLQMLKSYEEN